MQEWEGEEKEEEKWRGRHKKTRAKLPWVDCAAVGSVLCFDLLSQSYLGGRTLSAAGVAD